MPTSWDYSSATTVIDAGAPPGLYSLRVPRWTLTPFWNVCFRSGQPGRGHRRRTCFLPAKHCCVEPRDCGRCVARQPRGNDAGLCQRRGTTVQLPRLLTPGRRPACTLFEYRDGHLRPSGTSASDRDNLDVDIAAAHVFFPQSTVALSPAIAGAALRGSLAGTTQAYANVVGLQFSYHGY